jgi:DNA-directed RNA polymerase subunit RPC12/RpoP
VSDWKRESPELRWFEEHTYLCDRCGKRGNGVLRGSRNESYGIHCKRCADKRLADSKKAREHKAKEAGL